jgi:CheY-like chemotaxis protein
MPCMDGHQLTKRMLALPQLRSHLPVFVGLTADTGESTSQQGTAAGMHQVLHKPCTVGSLSVLLQQLQQEQQLQQQ